MNNSHQIIRHNLCLINVRCLIRKKYVNQIKTKINKLIEIGQNFNWGNCSHLASDGITRYGNKPSSEWNTWVSRIEKVLIEVVKRDSEPFIYFRDADSLPIQGNFKDIFELAKATYLKALTSVNSLFDNDIFGDLLVTAVPEKTPEPKINVNEESQTTSNKKVFIVHGHDHALKVELEVFLSHIGLTPIVLHREVDGGQTIIEKFEANSDVSYAFILLTPDEITYTVDQNNIKDEDRKKETRARPNVIFEFGYFVAKLGRNKVCVLHKGDVAIPSDLSGFIYKKVDKDIEEIGFSLIKELKSAGLKPEV